MKAGIVVFPGTNRERDMAAALRAVTGRDPVQIWHRDTELPKLDLIVLCGGFSYGDYLRCGAMAAHAPIMSEIRKFVGAGGYVLGVCNGFQILTEAQILPGALLRNANMRFLAQDGFLKVARAGTAFTRHWDEGAVFRVVMAHGDGNYVASPQELDQIEAEGRVAFRYVDVYGRQDEADPRCNPNGSARSIAGVLSGNMRVCGMMPHPENLVNPLMGGEDGKPLFAGMVEALTR